MKRSVLISLSALCLLMSVMPIAGAQTVPGNGTDRTRVIVQLDPSGPAPRAFGDDIVSRFGGRRGFVFEHAVSGFVAELPNAAIRALERNPNVIRVTPDRIVVQLQAQDVPTGWDRVETDLAPDPPTGGVCPQGETCTDVDIAILDTGVNAHPDLNVVDRTDCSGIIFPGTGQCADGTGSDGNSHGTHVAGTAAAFDNDFGVVGIAPGARIHSVKVLGDSGTGYLGGLIAGVDWVTANAGVIDVVNMSLSGEFADPMFDTAIANSVAAGVVYVVAAGNSSRDAAIESPANHPDVITTSAVADADGLSGGLSTITCRQGETDDTLASFSNFGSVVDIAAPGVCILSTGNDGGYSVKSGTSMASPHVAGAAARYIAVHGRDVDAVTAALIGEAHPQGTPCGFTGDTDGYPEPMLFLNGPAFGGNAVCDQLPLDPTPALPPGSLTADADGYPIHLDWTAGSDPETGIRAHRVYRDEVPSTGEILIATVGADVESYTDTDTEPSKTYTYEVTAVNLQFGESTRSAPAQATTVSDNPTDAGWWAYEDQQGTTGSDTTAWRRTATLQNGPSWEPNGKIAGSIELDGLDDRVDLDPGILDGAGDISFATYFRTTKTGTQTMISGANPGNENEYTIMFVNDTTLRFYSGSSANAGANWQLPESIADGEWHHLVVRRINGPSHVWAYIDGVSVGGWLITTQMEPVDIDGLVVGQDQDGVLSGFQSAEAFEGELDETRLFTRVLTQTEIDNLSGRDLTAPSAPASLSAIAVGHDIDLNWASATDPESGIAQYRISRDDGAGGPIVRLTEVPGTATSYRDTAVAGSTTYTYHVTAINGGEVEGPPSPSDSATTPAADTSLLGWWPLDDGSGSTATDASPGARHGTLVGGPSWQGEGKKASALSFDGNDDRVDLDHTILDGTTDLTVAMWVRTTNTGIQALISGANAANDAEYEWFLLSNPDPRLRFYTGEQNTSYVWWPTPSVVDGEWHHLAVTRDNAGDMAELFVDGVSQGTRSAVLEQLQLDPGGLVIAQDQDVVGGGFDPTQAFNGTLDEVRIYDRLLSANEIGVLAGLAPAPSTNTNPTLDPIGPKSVDEQAPLSFTATASDPDAGQSLTFGLSGTVPAGASIDPSSGAFSWTPTEVQGPGTYTFDVVVTDDGSPALSDSETIVVTVDEVDSAPVLGPIGDRAATEGVQLAFTVTATDPDLPTQSLTFSLDAGAPQGAAIDPINGEFTWTPSEAQSPGSYPISITVTDDTAMFDSESITVTVTETNTAPLLDAIADQAGDELSTITFTASATDADLPVQQLTYSLEVGSPPGASIDEASGAFTWTPTEAQGPGVYTFGVRVTDDGDPALFATETVTVTVSEVDSAPVLDPIGDKVASDDSDLTFTVTATDADRPSQTLTFSLVSPPSGASIDPSTGAFSWTPSESQSPGLYNVEIRVTDDTALFDSEQITIDVTDTNTAPVLAAIGDQAGDEMTVISFTATATDADVPQQTVSYELGAGAPTNATIDPVSGTFTWTPSEGEGPGVYTFDVIATDDGVPALSANQPVTVTVGETNTAPVLGAIGDQTIPEGSELAFTAAATDADLPAQGITYSLAAGAPPGASINPSSGAFTWTPTEAEGPGTHSITIIATDDGSAPLSDDETITVTVGEVNAAPHLSTLSDLSGAEGTPLTFSASATDADLPAQGLTFSLSGNPAGSTIDPTSGTFAWTPTEAQGPGVYTFDVIVTDDGTPTESDSQTITITVDESNVAPVADAGGDQSATVGQAVTLDGSGSTDADVPAQTLSYTWTFQSRPTGSTAALSSQTDVAPTFTPDLPGAYVLGLVVSDASETDSDTVTVTAASVPTVSVGAVSETTTFGLVVDGDLSATHVVDGVGETLEEERTSGNPRNRTSRLQHTWTFDVQPGDSVDIEVVATRPSNPDSDNFQFAYSIDGGSTFVTFATIGDASSGSQATLPSGTGGEVLVRVTDTDRRPGFDSRNTVVVDAIIITTTNPSAPLPEITVTATDPSADESGDTGAFTFSRDISDDPLSVAYEIGGSALTGTDYLSISGTVDFPAGVASVTVDIVPVEDILDEGDETVLVSLTAGPGYDIGPNSTAVVTIADNDSSSGGGEYRASSEQTTFGSVTAGDYTSTYLLDSDVESITEEHYTGQNRTRLEHMWTLTGITGSTGTLTIMSSSTGEAFTFDISLDGGSTWIALPDGLFSLNGASTLIVRVVDTDRNKGDTIRDTLSVDEILLVTN